MTTQELLKEVLKDSLFQDKYHIPQSELQAQQAITRGNIPLRQYAQNQMPFLKTEYKLPLSKGLTILPSHRLNNSSVCPI